MSKLYPYSHELAKVLASPPSPGENRHTWLFNVAAWLRAEGANLDDVQRRLEEAAKEAGWEDRLPEIARNIAKLKNVAVEKAAPKVWMPKRNEEAREIAFTAPPLFTLQPKGLVARDVLPGLFRPDELVCMAAEEPQATTQKLDDVLPIADRVQYVVANPMRFPLGVTQEGYLSPRSLGNAVLPEQRRYVVIEFDTGDPLEAQVRLLSALHTREAPLALAVFSGGKSIHGWFNVGGLRVPDKLQVFRRGARLGADASLWDRCKLVRMPGGLRRTEVRQEILYWEPEHAS